MVNVKGVLSNKMAMLSMFMGVGLLGMLLCGYGYAAQSTDLLIAGEATVKGTADVEIVKIETLGALAGANDAYNTEYTTRTVSMHPQIPNAGGDIVYRITYCNNSTTKRYELTGLTTPVATLQDASVDLYRLEVGDLARTGVIVEPGVCNTANVDFYRATGSNNGIVSYTLDFEWTEYNSTPFSIDYMQDMTPSECAKVTPREEKMLIDRRDGKKYWVAKLQDGNCWMVQNLAYDLKTSTPLTPADSDVASNWTPGSDTNMFHYSTTNYINDNTRWLSWNLGDNLMLAKPRAAENNICKRYGTSGSAIWAENLAQVCSWSMVLDVTGWSPTWKMQLATTNWPDSSWFQSPDKGWAAANPVTREYDQHYMVGNYYQWLTATAGSGTGITTNGMDAPHSICPKGWQLPTSPSGTITGAKSFANLYRAYGLINNPSQLLNGPAENNGYGIYWAPFYAVSSGYVAPYDGLLERFMEWGGAWSSTAWGSAYSYNLAFMPSMILRAQGGPNEWQLGMPVRCVAR